MRSYSLFCGLSALLLSFNFSKSPVLIQIHPPFCYIQSYHSYAELSANKLSSLIILPLKYTLFLDYFLSKKVAQSFKTKKHDFISRFYFNYLLKNIRLNNRFIFWIVSSPRIFDWGVFNLFNQYHSTLTSVLN